MSSKTARAADADFDDIEDDPDYVPSDLRSELDELDYNSSASMYSDKNSRPWKFLFRVQLVTCLSNTIKQKFLSFISIAFHSKRLYRLLLRFPRSLLQFLPRAASRKTNTLLVKVSHTYVSSSACFSLKLHLSLICRWMLDNAKTAWLLDIVQSTVCDHCVMLDAEVLISAPPALFPSSARVFPIFYASQSTKFSVRRKAVHPSDQSVYTLLSCRLCRKLPYL